MIKAIEDAKGAVYLHNSKTGKDFCVSSDGTINAEMMNDAIKELWHALVPKCPGCGEPLMVEEDGVFCLSSSCPSNNEEY